MFLLFYLLVSFHIIIYFYNFLYFIFYLFDFLFTTSVGNMKLEQIKILFQFDILGSLLNIIQNPEYSSTHKIIIQLLGYFGLNNFLFT